MPFHPKKRFGQNFLRDQRVVDRILQAADLHPDDHILEIGPGTGVLTGKMVGEVSSVTVLEIDTELCAFLREQNYPNFTLLQGDAVRMDWDRMLTDPPYKLVANLPYQVTSPILFLTLDFRDRFERLVLMMQREVARRLTAAPGTGEYGILSVFCNLWFDIETVVDVPPQAFFPRPKVHSTVLKFLPRNEPRAQVGDEKYFRRVVKAAFGQRRKTLRNALIGGGFEADGIDEALRQSGIDPKRRGETLGLDEFSRLCRDLMKNCGSAE